MPKISALAPLTAPADGDLLPIEDISATTTKALALSDLKEYILPNRTRYAAIRVKADGANGATESNDEGPEVQFTGTPTGFARGVVKVPADWVPGTDILIKLQTRAPSTNSSKGTAQFVGLHKDGDTFSAWNEQNNVSGTQSWTAGVVKEITMYTIPNASIEAGDYIVFAWRPTAALTGNVYLCNAYIAYTADM